MLHRQQKLLLVSFFFPPRGGAGTQRAGKLCKYLPARGWDAAVICDGDTGSGGYVTVYSDSTDDSLTGDIPPGTWIDRIVAESPDTWVAQARRLIERQQAESGFDAAFVTMSPFWMAPLVEELAAIVPTAVDLRDPWALDGVPTYSTKLGWSKDLARMRRTLNAAHAVIMNTEDAKDAALDAFPEISPAKVHAIQNGFDPDDIRRAMESPLPEEKDDAFRLVHTGTFLTKQVLAPSGMKQRVRNMLRYRPEPIQPLGRSVIPVLRAIEIVHKQQGTGSVRFTHAGSLDDATRNEIERASCSSSVEALGYLPHSESVRHLLGADGLFLHLHGLPKGHRARIIPGKTYEYLASGRPILAALPEGDARDLAAARERCFLADPCDPESIAAALSRMIQDKGSSAVPPLSDTDLAGFERRSIAARVAAVLDGLVGSEARHAAETEESIAR